MPRKPSNSKPGFQARVTVVPVEGASVLKTLDEKWDGWLLPRLPLEKEDESISENYFFRLRPPADVPESAVSSLKRWLEGQGASVKVELARSADVVPREESPRVERPHARAREVVEGLLAASRSDSREELAEFVRRKMDEAKL